MSPLSCVWLTSAAPQPGGCTSCRPVGSTRSRPRLSSPPTGSPCGIPTWCSKTLSATTNPFSSQFWGLSPLSVALFPLPSPLHSPPREAGAGSQDLDSITFFAFSLIEGYISIVMDAETQKR